MVRASRRRAADVPVRSSMQAMLCSGTPLHNDSNGGLTLVRLHGLAAARVSNRPAPADVR
jgi:hypothetical protein